MADSLITCGELGEVELGIIQSVCLIGVRWVFFTVRLARIEYSDEARRPHNLIALSLWLWLSVHEGFRRVQRIF